MREPDAEGFENAVFDIGKDGVIIGDSPIVGEPVIVEGFAPGVVALVPFVGQDAAAEGNMRGEVGPGGVDT